MSLDAPDIQCRSYVKQFVIAGFCSEVFYDFPNKHERMESTWANALQDIVDPDGSCDICTGMSLALP